MAASRPDNQRSRSKESRERTRHSANTHTHTHIHKHTFHKHKDTFFDGLSCCKSTHSVAECSRSSPKDVVSATHAGLDVGNGKGRGGLASPSPPAAHAAPCCSPPPAGRRALSISDFARVASTIAEANRRDNRLLIPAWITDSKERSEKDNITTLSRRKNSLRNLAYQRNTMSSHLTCRD